MCVGLKLKIKAVNPNAPRVYRVGCGNCEECRAVYKESWNFRLTAELEALMGAGWQCGFLTLTYSDLNINVLSLHQLWDDVENMPAAVSWREMSNQERIERFGHDFFTPKFLCFRKSDVQEWIINARQWLIRKYECVREWRLRYIVCGEFGAKTKRPHYHALLIFPPFVDARAFYDYLHESWSLDHGHVFPRYFEGGFDGKINHKPFLVESYAKAARYVSKYTTKDIYYDEYLTEELGKYGLSLTPHKKDLKDFLAFHCQSKSLGSTILERFKTDADKLNALKNGVFFVGEDKPRVLPIYLKNKLLYDNVYQYEFISPDMAKMREESGEKVYSMGSLVFKEDFPCRRLVRREASKFFHDNIEEIFKLKVAKYSEFFSQFRDEIAMLKREAVLRSRWCGLGKEFPDLSYLGNPWWQLSNFMQKEHLTCDDVAALYLCFYGVKPNIRRFVHPSLYPYLYLSRYYPKELELPQVEDKLECEAMNNFLDCLFCILDSCFKYWSCVPKVRSLEECDADFISDSFKSEDYYNAVS